MSSRLDKLCHVWLIPLLAVVGYVAMIKPSAAEQNSLEDATHVAGLPMKTATVFVNGTSI